MELTHKQMSSRGGTARAKKLSKKRRKEIAMMGVRARFDKSVIHKRNVSKV